MVPDEAGLAPAYGQKAFDEEAARSGFLLLASTDGRDDTIRVHQDVDLLVARLGPGDRRQRPLAPGRSAWVHVARGQAALGGTDLSEGDGAAVSGEEQLVLEGRGEAEVLLFDLG